MTRPSTLLRINTQTLNLQARAPGQRMSWEEPRKCVKAAARGPEHRYLPEVTSRGQKAGCSGGRGQARCARGGPTV